MKIRLHQLAVFFALTALLGATDSVPQIETVSKYLLETKRKVDSIESVPEDIREHFIFLWEPYRGIVIEELPQKIPNEKREEIAQRIRGIRNSRDWIKETIKDRNDKYHGGCTGGDIHFLEAGELPYGWWIFYESGGYVGDTKSLIVITREKSSLVISDWIGFTLDGKTFSRL